jgi:hypothetical protein
MAGNVKVAGHLTKAVSTPAAAGLISRGAANRYQRDGGGEAAETDLWT